MRIGKAHNLAEKKIFSTVPGVDNWETRGNDTIYLCESRHSLFDQGEHVAIAKLEWLSWLVREQTREPAGYHFRFVTRDRTRELWDDRNTLDRMAQNGHGSPTFILQLISRAASVVVQKNCQNH